MLEKIIIAQMLYEQQTGNVTGVQLLKSQLQLIQTLVAEGLLSQMSFDEFQAFREAAQLTDYPVQITTGAEGQTTETDVTQSARRGRREMSIADANSFGAQLRVIRQEKGLTITQVANLAFQNPHARSYLSRIEHGKISHPGQENMNQLAKVLGVVIDVSTRSILIPPQI